MFDFNIYSDKDRANYIKKELASNPSPTQKELESMANYILFGKDQNGQNAVERGEVEIETKYKTYKKKAPESLNELMESPTFDERNFKPLSRGVYKNPKPTINKNLPELYLLEEEIIKWQHIYDVAIGKEKDPKLKPKTQTEIYKIKHFLIDLKKQQYVITEALQPVFQSFGSTDRAPIYDEEDIGLDVKPLGLKIGEIKRFIDPKEDKDSTYVIPTNLNTLDLENPIHIYGILEYYSVLLEESLDNPYSNGKYLIETLDFYIDRTPLEPSRKTILDLKKHKVSNQEIKRELERLYGLSYNENYISTIYTKEICKKIAEAVTLHKDYWLNRNDASMWKKCSCCGQWKLKDAREFTRKKSSSDGFTSRCKICDKKKRRGE